jgi:hypothetical protein
LTTSTEKGWWYYDIERKVGKDPWYNTRDTTNRNTRTINRIIAGYANTPEWLAILYICPRHATSRAKYNLLEGQTAIKTFYAKADSESWKQVIYFPNEIKMQI